MEKSPWELLRSRLLLTQEERRYLVFIRHGESRRQSREESHSGYDTPLSEQGEFQAHALAKRLEERTVHTIYSSPLKRAHETAIIVGNTLGLNVSVKEDLREVEIDREKTRQKMKREEKFMSEDLGSNQNDGSDRDLFGLAESRESVLDRVKNRVDWLVSNHPGETILLFTHTGIINTYFSHILGMDSNFICLPAHTGVSTVRALNDRRVVGTINDYSHLR